MVRLADLPDHLANRYASADCPVFEATPMVDGPPLSDRRVAIISSAGLNLRNQSRFLGGDKDCRAIPAATEPSDILMSHVSLGFDRTGFYQDLNTVFPIDRLRSLVDEGFIGSVSDTHYSFMGGSSPDGMEVHADEMVRRLREDNVSAALLLPV